MGSKGTGSGIVIANSFWDKETSNQSTSAGGTGLTTQQMQTAQTFINAGWHEELNDDGDPIWILKDGSYPKLWFEESVSNKILILSSDSKVISRDEADENWIQVGESLSSSLFEDYGLDDVSKYTNIDWQMLHNNFTAPFSFKIFRESDVAPIIRQTASEKEFGVLGSVYEKELSENELEEIRNIVIG